MIRVGGAVQRRVSVRVTHINDLFSAIFLYQHLYCRLIAIFCRLEDLVKEA